VWKVIGLTSNPKDNWADPLSGINKKRLKVNAINKINFTNLNPRITGDPDNQTVQFFPVRLNQVTLEEIFLS
jgi:hypothetical protein